MSLKTSDELKKYFRAGNKPSQLNWDNFFDSLAPLETWVEITGASTGPVIPVASQAARLTLGPSVAVGRQVREADTGRTFVKQEEDGSLVGHWEDIGDSDIQISDVVGLQAALDDKLNRLVTDETPYRLSGFNFWSTQSPDAAEVNETGLVSTVGLNFNSGPAFRYGAVTKDFTIVLGATNPGLLWNGMKQTLVVATSKMGGVNFTQPDDLPDTGNGVSKFVLVGNSYPVAIDDNSIALVEVQRVRMDTSDPDYSANGHYYFITVASMNVIPPDVVSATLTDAARLAIDLYGEEIAITLSRSVSDTAQLTLDLSEGTYEVPPDLGEEGLGEDTGTLLVGFNDGNYHPGRNLEQLISGMSLDQSPYVEVVIPLATIEENLTSSMSLDTSPYEDVVIVFGPAFDSLGATLGLDQSPYVQIVLIGDVPEEESSQDTTFTGGSVDSLVQSPGLLTAAPNQDTTFTGGTADNDESAPPLIIYESGLPSPWPYSIYVGSTDAVTTIKLKLTGFSHNFPDDVSVALTKTLWDGSVHYYGLMFTRCGNGNSIAPETPIDLTLDDGAGSNLSDSGILTTGTYLPTYYAGSDASIPFISPLSTKLTSEITLGFADFIGINPVGLWKVWVYDDIDLDGGGITDITLTINGVDY